MNKRATFFEKEIELPLGKNKRIKRYATIKLWMVTRV